MRLAKEIKETYNIPVFYYVSPQFWAWKEKRVKYIKKYVDSLVVLFPFEVEWYKKHNIHVSFFGHPLVESYQRFLTSFKKAKKNGFFYVALFPGSRKQEVKIMLPIMLKTIANFPQYRFVIICVKNIKRS